MASKSLGSLTVDLIAKVGGFVQGMDKAARSAAKGAEEIDRAQKGASRAINNTLKNLENQVATLGKSSNEQKLYKLEVQGATKAQLAQAKAAIDSIEAFERSERQHKKMISIASGVGKALGALAIAAPAAAAAIVKGAVDSAREIEQLSQVANTSVEEFQRWSAGAQTMGIEQEKLADILKDMNDRVGDFLSTGGGPMADFFENIAPQVGVTAEQFRRLSGPEALQLFVDSLEKANLAQGEMTFYMEAIASDSTRLLPLLRGNGEEMERLGDHAEMVGAVLSELEIDQLAEVRAGLDELGLTFAGLGNEVAMHLLPYVGQVIDLLNDPGTIAGIKSLAGGVLEIAAAALEAATEFANFGTWLGETLAVAVHGPAIGDLIRLEKELIDLERERYAAWAQAEGMFRDGDKDLGVKALDAQIAKTKEMIRITNELAADAKKAADQQVAMADLLVPKELLERTNALGAAYGKTGQQIAAAAKKSAEAEKAFIKEVEEGAKALAKQQQEAQKLAGARDKWYGDIGINIDALQQEIAALKQGEAAHQAVTRELAIQAEMRAAVSAGIIENDAAARRMIETQYDLQTALAQVNKDQEEAARVAEQTAKDMETAWNRGIERIRDGLGDFFINIFETGKVTFRDLTDLFKRMIAEMVATAAANKILLAVGLGGPSGGGGGFNVGSLLSGAKSLFSGITSLLSGGGLASLFGGGASSASAASLFGSTGTAGTLMVDLGASAGTTISESITAGFSKAAAYWPLAVIAGMYQSGKLYDQGVRPDAGEMWASGGSNIAAQIGNIAPTLMSGVFDVLDKTLGGGKLAAIITGSTFHQALWTGINEALWGGKYETTRGGVQLGFGDDGFDPMEWSRQTKKGGAFGSTKRRFQFADLDSEIDAALMQTYSKTVEGVRQLYEQIGVGIEAGALEGIKIAELKIGTFGKSEQTEKAINEQINQWFTDLQAALVSGIDSTLSVESLQELVFSITAVNPVLDVLGLNLLDISKDGAWAAKELLRVAGGLENLAAASDFYYQNFYTEEERLAQATEQLSAVFASLGLQMPTTHQGFRNIVEGLDLMNAEQRETFAALMNLAPAFDAVTKGADAATQASQQAAAALRNTLTDIAGTALNQYNNTLAARATLEQQLANINGDIADLMADMDSSATSAADTLATIPNTIANITAGVDDLAASSSQLQSWAKSIQATVQQLMLSDVSPLTNRQRFDEAQRQLAMAQVLAEQGDPSQLAAATQTFLRENAAYFGNTGTGIGNFNEAIDYLESMGASLETESERAERIETQQRAAQEAQQIALDMLNATTKDAAAASGDAAKMAAQQQQLQTLLAEQQRIELALANAYAVDAEAILGAQLQALIDVNDGVGSLAHLLSMLPADLAAAIGGVVGVAPQQYGGDLVNQLYRDVLGRQGQASGVAYWQSVQAQGFGTENLVNAFIAAAMQNGENPLMSASQFLGTLPAFASGGDYAGGLAVVGEEGPEVINFRRGGYVHNAAETSEMLGGGARLAPLMETLINRVERVEAQVLMRRQDAGRFHGEDRRDMRQQTSKIGRQPVRVGV